MSTNLSLAQDTANQKSISNAMNIYCQKLELYFKKYGWGESHCKDYSWNHVRDSVNGDPLSWVVFGDEKLAKEKGHETTLILCGIHGDEITPIKFCFDIMENILKQGAQSRLVLVAPIVNPDSFFKEKPTRTNSRNIDINRNFPTGDWNRLALKLWSTRYGKDPRRFPGHKALSEPEVVFQINLIKRYQPHKIISVHAPLTMLDYDGPGDMKRASTPQVGREANELLIQMSQKAKDYRITNFPFYPGSLGNYAGNERNIPTYTIELPSSDPSKSQDYWELFHDAINEAISRDLRKSLEEKSNVAMDKQSIEEQNKTKNLPDSEKAIPH